MMSNQKNSPSHLPYESKSAAEKMDMNKRFPASWTSQPMGCLLLFYTLRYKQLKDWKQKWRTNRKNGYRSAGPCSSNWTTPKIMDE